jgi:hypothetical protein
MRLPKLPLNIAQLQRGTRFTGWPEPGFFKMRLVRGGPWVAALIWRPCPMILPQPSEMTPALEDWCFPTERPRLLRATISEDEASPNEVWERGSRISPREYQKLLDVHRYAVAYAPHEPEANPRRKVDLGRQPSIF